MFERLKARIRGAMFSEREITEHFIREGYRRQTGQDLDEFVRSIGINPSDMGPVFDDLTTRFCKPLQDTDLSVCRPAAAESMLALARHIDRLVFESEQRALKSYQP